MPTEVPPSTVQVTSSEEQTVAWPVYPVEILSYDNNKYATVRLPNGETTEIKTGYIYKDEKLTIHLRNIDWFVLGGGNRKYYKARERSNEFFVKIEGKKERILKNRADAIALCSRQARITGEETEIWVSIRRKGNNRSYSVSGMLSFECGVAGDVVKYHQRHKRRGRQKHMDPVYLRGYGKISDNPQYHRVVQKIRKKRIGIKRP